MTKRGSAKAMLNLNGMFAPNQKFVLLLFGFYDSVSDNLKTQISSLSIELPDNIVKNTIPIERMRFRYASKTFRYVA
jgi:hypothetical protein